MFQLPVNNDFGVNINQSNNYNSGNEGYIFFFFNDRRPVCYKKKIIGAALKTLLRPFSETIFRWWQCYLSFEG